MCGRDKINAAIELLAHHVSTSGIPANDVFELAKKAGISDSTLKRAKRTIGVKSRKRGGNEWLWVMTEAAYDKLFCYSECYKPTNPVVYISRQRRTTFVNAAASEATLPNILKESRPFDISKLTRIFLICETIVFRGKFDYFAQHIPHILESDMAIGTAFIFCNKSKSQIGILQWLGDGYTLFFKQSEYGRFLWPSNTGAQVIEIATDDLKMLIKYPQLMRRLSGREMSAKNN